MTDHRPTLDSLSPAQIRVVLERLLMTMQSEARRDFMEKLPGLYCMVYPTVTIAHCIAINNMVNQ
jgi:hypothetical protein